MRVSAILLGAGESKRMKINKLALPWGRRTVLERSLEALARSTVEEVIVVLNPKNVALKRAVERIAKTTQKSIKVVLNPFYQRGMSSSIRRGLGVVHPRADGILISLGDQPFLKTRTINSLLQAFHKREGEIVVPSFRGMRGHPVIFHRSYRGELLRLRGDEGGRKLLLRHSGEVRTVPVRSEGVIKDIDTWREYRDAVRRGKRKHGRRCSIKTG